MAQAEYVSSAIGALMIDASAKPSTRPVRAAQAEFVLLRVGRGVNSVHILLAVDGDPPVVQEVLRMRDLLYLRHIDDHVFRIAALHGQPRGPIPDQHLAWSVAHAAEPEKSLVERTRLVEIRCQHRPGGYARVRCLVGSVPTTVTDDCHFDLHTSYRRNAKRVHEASPGWELVGNFGIRRRADATTRKAAGTL
jgi:hypothetical protein